MSPAILGRVLVVDDELQLMEALVEALNAQGYEAHGFPTGLAAIEALQQREFDLLLTDLMMPGMDGITLLKACKAIDPNLVGIVMTGQGTVPTAVEAMKTGAFDYVLKPFRLDVILPVLARAREMQQLRLENIQLRAAVALYDLSQTISSSLDSQLVLEKTIEAALKQTGAEEASILLLTPDKEQLYVAVVRGRDREHLLGNHMSLEAGIAGWVARQSEPLILNGEVSDPRFAPIQPHPEIRSAISMPMMTAGKLIGILNINSLQARHPFTAGQVKALSILTSTAAAALENERLFNTLEAREKRFRALIENAPDGIALLGMDGKLRQVTPSTEQILGYTLEEAVGQDPALLTHPEDLPNLLALLSDLIQNPEKNIRAEFRFMHKDGSWRWLESTISNLISEPSVESIVFNYRDITERKRAEAELQRAKDFAENVIQTANVIFLQLDTFGNVSKLNNTAEEISGYSLDEIVGKSWFETLVPRNRYPYVWDEFIRIAQRGETTKIFENPILTKHGEERHVIWKNNVLQEDDEIIGTISFGVDITERKQTEEALRESEEQYRGLFEDSPISLWVEDFSEVKRRLDQLKEEGVEDLSAYLREHSDFVIECANLVQILDVNSASVKLYRARDKAELFGSLMKILPTLPVEQFERELVLLASGQLNFEREGVDQTLTGETIYVNLRWTVAPGYEETLARVIVSTIDVTERNKAEQRIQRQLQRLSALRAIDLAISSTFDLQMSLVVLLNGTVSQLDVSAAAILLFNQPMLTLEYAAGNGFSSSTIQQTRIRLGEGFAGRAALEHNTVHTDNLAQAGSDFARAESLKEEAFVSYYGVPLIAKGELKGVLEIFHRAELHPDQEWLDFLHTLAAQAAIAIDNGQLFEGLRRSNLELGLAYDATIEGWSRAMDLRDKETEGHTQRVTDLTLNLARAMDIDAAELIHMRRGALLHDMGKLGVPDNILLKPGKLTDEEWEIMRKHPQFAYNMLSEIQYLKPALDIPYCHHEKWDGTGYPRNLKGEEIPLSARIFAVVDVWDAVTSDRPYRKAWSRQDATQYIRNQSGKHFDPHVLNVFLNMIAQL